MFVAILQIDHFHMSQPIFPPHPHAGFSAVTLMFEDSEGSFTNRDTLSEKVVPIHPGDVHWTTAARYPLLYLNSYRGLMHEEIPVKKGVDSHGLQIFANLAAKDKLIDPRADHLDAKETLIHEKDGARVRVLTGEAFGLQSPRMQCIFTL